MFSIKKILTKNISSSFGLRTIIAKFIARTNQESKLNSFLGKDSWRSSPILNIKAKFCVLPGRSPAEMTREEGQHEEERNLIVNYIPANFDDARLRVSFMHAPRTKTQKRKAKGDVSVELQYHVGRS